MADDESFFVSADEADDDGRRAPGHAPPCATPRDPAATTTTTTTTLAHRSLGSDSDDDDAVDRTANETMEDSDASFVSGDDAGGDALGRGARDAGAETTTTTNPTTTIAVGGEASATDGEFVSGADTDTGVDGRARPTGTGARVPGRAPPLRTTPATGPALSEGEEEGATHSNSRQPASPGTMLNEAWELAMRAQDRDRTLDEDDPPTPLTLFKDALDEGDGEPPEEEDDDEDEDEEEGGFASAGNNGAGDPAGPPGPQPGDASAPRPVTRRTPIEASAPTTRSPTRRWTSTTSRGKAKRRPRRGAAYVAPRPCPRRRRSSRRPIARRFGSSCNRRRAFRRAFRRRRRRSRRRETREAVGARAAPATSKRGGCPKPRRCSRRRRGTRATTTTTSSTSSRAPATGKAPGPRAPGPRRRRRRRPHRGSLGVYPPGRAAAAGPDPVRSARTGDRTGTFLRTDTAGRTPRRGGRSAGGFRRSGTWRS